MFLMGNESGTVWQWRGGFRLLPYPGTVRLPDLSGEAIEWR